MTLLYILGDTLLYACFALLIGHFSLQLIPHTYRPDVAFPIRWIRLLILLIPVFFSLSVIRIVLYLQEDIGLWLTLRSVLLTFEAGNALILMTICCILLFLVVRNTSLHSGRLKFALFLLLAMVGTLAWSGHASSITGAEGLLVHTAHALSVFIWTGGLLVLGYSNASNPSWDNVLEWFRPLVTLCFLIILGSGIYLMSVVVKIDDYPNSWILPYGQALLWKHVLILPVLIIGFMNGKWSYASSKQTLKVKQMRMRMEGTLILFIFAATALLGQQEPPHSVEDTLKSSGAGQLSAFVFPNLRFEYSNIEFEPGMTSVLFLVIGLLFGGLVVFLIRKTNESIKTLFLGLGMSVSLFLAFLYSISLTF